jgi:hypothetical protein
MMHEALNFHTKRIFLSGRNEFNLFQKIHRWFWLIFHCMEFPEKFDNDQQLLISNSLRYVNLLPHFLVLENRKQAPPPFSGFATEYFCENLPY